MSISQKYPVNVWTHDVVSEADYVGEAGKHRKAGAARLSKGSVHVKHVNAYVRACTCVCTCLCE